MARLRRILRCPRCGGALGTVALTKCERGSHVGIQLEVVCMRSRCKKTHTFDMRFVNDGPIPSGTPVKEVVREA